MKKLLNAKQDDDGRILIEVKWYGFNDTIWQDVVNVLQGAHSLLKKFNNSKLTDQVNESVKETLLRKIKERENEVMTVDVMECEEKNSDDQE